MDVQLPTTDVLDTGNKPGEGPLRAGGQPGSATRRDADLPSTRSASSEKQQAAVGICRDLLGGTESVRAAKTAYLPQAPGEDSRNYADRLARAVFFNAFRRTVEGLAGLIFRKDPVLSDDVPDVFREDWENIDNEGTHGDVFCRDIEADALAVGHAAILVEYPYTGGAQWRSDEVAGGIRPYWLPIKKEDILSWRTTVEAGVRVLTQLVLRERTVEPEGMFGEKTAERYRVFIRDGKTVGFVLLEVDKNKNVIEIDQGLYPTQVEIPVAEIQTSGSTSLFESDPPLMDLAYLNIAHYQDFSDYRYAIHKTNVPFLFGAGIPESYDANGNKVDAIVVGPNTSLLASDSSARMEYVSHDGASLGASRQALEDMKSDMGTLGLAMLSPQKRMAETAESKRLDKSTSDSSLSVSARALQDGLEKAMGFHARYRGLDGTGWSITINRDFEGLLMDAPVMSAFAQLVNVGFPPEAVLYELQKGGRIAEDANLEDLLMQWLSGAEAKAENEAMRKAEATLEVVP